MSELLDRAPLIGVTVGNRGGRDGTPRLAVNRTYVSALQQAGAAVVLLPPPPAGEPAVAPGLLDRLDGILLPGGVDVDPGRYGQEPREWLGEVDRDLDALEVPLVGLAIERRVPLFGICRGHQVVNVALGGTLYQDVARDGCSDLPHAAPRGEGRDSLAHPVEVRSGTRLHALLRTGGLEVNSFHHQAVRDVAPGLVVSAVRPADGVVEGLETPDGLVLTVQCHPEELTDRPWARALFEAFVAAAAAARLTVQRRTSQQRGRRGPLPLGGGGGAPATRRL